MHSARSLPDPVPLAGSQRALSTLLANLPGAAYECAIDAPWPISYVSSGVRELTGHPPEFFTQGGTWGAITHPDDFQELKRVVDEAILARKPFVASYRIRSALGDEKWVREHGEAILSPAGDPTSIVGFICDITQQMRMEERVQEIEHHAAWVLQLEERLAWAAGASGAATELSDKFLDAIGKRREEALGWGWTEALHPEDQEALAAYWTNAIATGSPIDMRFRVRIGDEGYRWYRARGAPRRNADGVILGWHGTSENIDNQVRAEIRLEAAEAQLIHLSRDKVMHIMAATLAHEINQPLTAAANYLAVVSNLFRRSLIADDDKIRQSLRDVEQQIFRAGDIIGHVRTLVQHDGPFKKKVKLSSLLDHVTKLMKASGYCPGLKLIASIRRDAANIAVDQIQIEQVLLNLFRNACAAMSHLPAPTIDVFAETLGDCEVKVTVKDSGSGLADGARENLFVAYGYSSTNGLGAGLSICRTIVEAHGGRIWAERNAGAGMSFMFTVPLASPDVKDKGGAPA
jgi:PAS domain S-box-containing protein